jgi:hypothetical protein
MTGKTESLEIVTKVEGAERLLRTGVDLFFENKDMLSIHALSSAAHEVLHTLLKTQGKRVSLMEDNPFLRKDKAKEYHDLIHRTQNFLKHAAKDPKERMQYYKAQTPYWLFDAIQLYVQLTGNIKYKIFALYVMWFKLEHRYLLDEKAVEQLLTMVSVDAQYLKDNYKSFLENTSLAWWDELS